jgi:Rrf2 family nitric oxide-sensitive transcriptional repressor
MRLTIRTNLALRTLMFCAANPGKTVRKHDAAVVCNASANHLAQVIHGLALAGFLTTVRGRSGGLRLSRPASQIVLGDVVRQFESFLPFTPCMDITERNCPLAGCCRLKCAFSEALEAFYGSLDRLTLADLVHENDNLTRLLHVA